MKHCEELTASWHTTILSSSRIIQYAVAITAHY